MTLPATREGDTRAARARASSNGLKITALATGFVMASLDTTVVNVAGARIQDELHASLTQLTWIVDGYVLTFAALLLLAGGLANRLGSITTYMWGMGIFSGTSLACALAPNGGFLVLMRLIQGAGAAMFMPSSLALLVHSFPNVKERTKMLGLWSAIVATSAGLGPTLGGLMVSAFGWPSIFLINLPIGIIGMFLTWRVISPVAPHTTRIPFVGNTLGVITLAALSYTLIEGTRLGWTSGQVASAAAIALLAACSLALVERRASVRVMPWPLFSDPRFAGANIIGFTFNFALFGGIFMLGLFFQHARGASPFQAGLELLPMTIFFPIANIVYSRISGRYSNGPLLTAFLLLAGCATAGLVTIGSSTPYWVLALAVGIANIGAGIISPGMTAVLVDAAGPSHAAASGSVLNANRQVGSLVGIAAMGIVIASSTNWYTSAATAFGLMAAAYFIGALCAWRLILVPDRHAARQSSDSEKEKATERARLAASD